MTERNIIAENPHSTVIAEYTPVEKDAQKYQSEAELEAEFIRLLQKNGYAFLRINNNDDLLKNLRKQLERLNALTFSDKEWKQILDQHLANKKESIEEKTARIQENHIYSLMRDDGTTKNFKIIDKENIHNNSVQVLNQYEAEGARQNRYDVTILINGLPLVHIELKRRGVAIREAFNQINRYQRESFWSDSGLFEFVQLFVISNGTHTKYYSNTTRNAHVKEHNSQKTGKKTSNSFEFTSWWTDGQNNRISDLVDFARTFLSKHTLLSVITTYCVFTSEKLLLVMRPYQIVAAERILNKITMSTNLKKLGCIEAGGYIWHTTGSGKTLTSFKTAQLASKLDFVDKVLFVVDRKDLDHQTMREYDRFEKGAANSNSNTRLLAQQLANPDVNIIITTIQKLSRFVEGHKGPGKGHSIFDGHIVLIFDECHRSQFGAMHTQITKAFKDYHLFGFTGTPIFAVNAKSGHIAGAAPHLKTTEQAFGQKLHAYTIVNAINDGNVLPFRVSYANTIRIKDGIEDKEVHAIDKRAASAPARIRKVTDYILEHFDQQTKRSENYAHKGNRVYGFNSLFAVESIDAAKLYYTSFKNRMKDRPSKLKIALIYSFGANEAEGEDGLLPDEDFETDHLDKSSRDFLEEAITDYNRVFSTNFDTSADKFGGYYQDLSNRLKNREVDLAIVVNMFLTGFDATTLNTLWVDKNLRHHGLLQAFSRTNRILNSVKTYGNIVCFRNLEQATNEAISIFGDREAGGIVLLKPYEAYYNGYEKDDGTHQEGYIELVGRLKAGFPPPVSIEGEKAEKAFIKLWGAILRLRNILSSFDQFKGQEILSERENQDYQSVYLDLYDKHRKHTGDERENIDDDLVFEIELVKQVTIDIDYILQLVAQYKHSDDKEILVTIDKAMNSNIELRSKKELIEQFINTLNVESDVEAEWPSFRDAQLEKELEEIILQEKLKPEETHKFIANAFRDGELRVTGSDFANIMPPISFFSPDNALAKKKRAIGDRLRILFEKYSGV